MYRYLIVLTCFHINCIVSAVDLQPESYLTCVYCKQLMWTQWICTECLQSIWLRRLDIFCVCERCLMLEHLVTLGLRRNDLSGSLQQVVVCSSSSSNSCLHYVVMVVIVVVMVVIHMSQLYLILVIF